ncbi:hypothetical protein C8R42DRAFT_718727 [Lentinula raphanica]|nr:hypothetical protein C8R42DRAFT_718727 [Lentinula raphanica]
MTVSSGERSGSELVNQPHDDTTGFLSTTIEKGITKRMTSIQSPDPYNVVEMAIAIASEQEKVKIAFKARDAAIQHLSRAYTSIEQKLETIRRLETVVTLPTDGEESKLGSEKLENETIALESFVNNLRKEIEVLQQDSLSPRNDSLKTPDDPKYLQPSAPLLSRNTSDISASSFVTASDIPQNNGPNPEVGNVNITDIRTTATCEDAEDIINARNKLLASLPLPEEAPDDALKPIAIPTAYMSLYEFLASVPGPLRSSLSNYLVLHQLTTSWCPQREEHGYFLTPVFKCSTNPRVTTAHQWTATDVMATMSKPTECFFNKDGVWYYAGVYKAFRLDDLTVKEWAALSTETTQAIVKETIEGRKNISPQNVYEVNQLYCAGALKVAVVALQCIGFNHSMYRLLLDHASKCSLSAVTAENRKSSMETPSLSSTSSAVKMKKNAFNILGSSVLGNESVKPNISRSASYSFGFGLGLGSSNIWNTNMGVGLAVGGIPTSKGADNHGVEFFNASIKSKLDLKANSPGKNVGEVENENNEVLALIK